MPLDNDYRDEVPADVQVEQYVAELNIETELPEAFAPEFPKFERSLIALDSRSTIIFGRGLDLFLKGYLERWPYRNTQLGEDALKEKLEVAFDEGTQPLTRYLLKLHMDEAKPIGLAALARLRWPDTKTDINELRARLADKVLYEMRDLRLWSVEVLPRKVQGRAGIAGYNISAGPALIHFERFLFRPYRQKQLRQFFDKFGGDL